MPIASICRWTFLPLEFTDAVCRPFPLVFHRFERINKNSLLFSSFTSRFACFVDFIWGSREVAKINAHRHRNSSRIQNVYFNRSCSFHKTIHELFIIIGFCGSECRYENEIEEEEENFYHELIKLINNMIERLLAAHPDALCTAYGFSFAASRTWHINSHHMTAINDR